MTDAPEVLTVRGLQAGFQQPLLGPLDLTVRAGERCVLSGPNGSGKSLLLKALVGRARVFSGHLRLAAGLAYLAQEHARPSPWPLSGYDWFAAMQAPLPDLALLQPLLARRLDRLSGGQWQLLRLAAVLQSAAADGAGLVLLDEPSNHLDARVRGAAADLLLSLPSRVTVLMTSHDQVFIDYLGWPVTSMESLHVAL